MALTKQQIKFNVRDIFFKIGVNQNTDKLAPKIGVYVYAALYLELLGIIANSGLGDDRFPSFIVFESMLSAILIIDIYSIQKFIIATHKIHEMMSGDEVFHAINTKFNNMQSSFCNFIIPITVVLFYSISGLSLLTINVNLIMISIFMVTFVAAVFLSIIVYLQYVYLVIYIKRIANISTPIKNYDSHFPAETDWLVGLNKLYYSYRNAFFFIGTLYILAFGFFCFSKEYVLIESLSKTNTVALILCWLVIFLAIVLVFPIVSIYEHYKIKSITQKLKAQSITFLEKSIEPSLSKKGFFIERLVVENFIATIKNSTDLPQKSTWGQLYAIMSVIINLYTSIMTIVKIVNPDASIQAMFTYFK